MGSRKFKVYLCKNCIEELKYDNPYRMPRENLIVHEVSIDQCDNLEENEELYNAEIEAGFRWIEEEDE